MRNLMQAFDKYGAEAGVEHTAYRPLFYWIYHYQYQHLYLNVYLKREVPLSSPPQPVAYRFAPRFAVAGCDHHYSPRFGMEEMEK
jgi:hypothetical protein